MPQAAMSVVRSGSLIMRELEWMQQQRLRDDTGFAHIHFDRIFFFLIIVSPK